MPSREYIPKLLILQQMHDVLASQKDLLNSCDWENRDVSRMPCVRHANNSPNSHT